MSGDLENTAMPVALYQRMPQLPTMNSNGQQIPRIWLPEAIADGKAEGYPLGRQVDRAPVRQVHLSGARPFAGEDALQVRRLDPRHHEQHQPPGADVPVGESGVRRQPVDLVRGRGEVRRRHAAGLHQFRAHRHLANGRGSAATAITASSSSTTASSSSRRRRSSRSANRSPTSGSSTRSASGSASPNYFSEGINEIDWVKRIYLASDLPKVHLVARSSSSAATTSCRPRRRSCARRCRSAGSGRAARRTCRRRSRCRPTTRGISARPADPVRQARIRVQQPQALQGPGAAADRQIRAVVGGPAFARMFERYPLQLLTPHSKYSASTPRATARSSFLYNIADHRVKVDG